MKIAVIAKTRLEIDEPFRGGLEAFTHTICKEYIRSGHDVTLYAHADSDPSLNVKSFYGSEKRSDEYFELYENDEYLSIIRDIEQNDFDVVHNNATHELPIIWGATASIPVITTLHTPPIAKLKAAISLASTSDNLKFVTISHSFNETWRPYLQNGSTIIYNGINLDEWPMSRIHKEYLFWYGRIVHAKGLDIALDVAHAVGLPLHFAGSVDDEEYFERQIRQRINTDDVYLGHLQREDILKNMQGAGVLINSVRWEEPFGLTNIEAMSAGVPVAGFDRGAFVEIIDSRSGAVAEGTNVSSLAAAVKDAMELDSYAARNRAKQFSMDSMIENYIALFKESI